MKTRLDLEQSNWKILADLVKEACARDDVVTAIASKTLKPLHDELLRVCKPISPHPKRVLTGAAAASVARARARMAVAESTDWRDACRKILKDHGPLDMAHAQRSVMDECRSRTGMNVLQAKHATDEIIKEMGW